MLKRCTLAVIRIIRWWVNKRWKAVNNYVASAELRQFVLLCLGMALIGYLINNGTFLRWFDSEYEKRHALHQKYGLENQPVVTDSRRTFERFTQWDAYGKLPIKLFVTPDGFFSIVNTERDNRVIYTGVWECIHDAGNSEHAVGEFRITYTLYNEEVRRVHHRWTCQWPQAKLTGPMLFEAWVPHSPKPHPAEVQRGGLRLHSPTPL